MEMLQTHGADVTRGPAIAAARGRNWRISGMETRSARRTVVEPPSEPLAHLVTVYEAWTPPAPGEIPDENGRALWILPGEARLVIVEPGCTLSAMIGNRRYESLPRIALFGPTSRATRLVASGSQVTMIGLSALGWASLVARSAAALADRAIAAADVLDARLVAALGAAAEDHADEGGALARRFDPVIGVAPCVRPPDEPLVRGLAEIIARGVICVAEAAGAELGVASHVVRRSALRHFGYPPKVLLNRRRFVRALERMMVSDRGYSEAARHGYFDASHFIRDAKRFLGMTPRRFLALAA